MGNRVAAWSPRDKRTLGYDSIDRLTSDTLATSGGTQIAKIGYGWDNNGNETSKTATSFGGTTAANAYGYDLANRLTDWNNGTNDTPYAYDQAGNRTQNGSKYMTYDEQDRLQNDGTSTYTYTPRGTLATTVTAGVTQHTAADAFGQVASQQSPGGTETYGYDALGRAIRPGFSYTGLGNDLASDGTSTYTRDTSGAVLGEQTGSTQRLAWTDLHDDIVGQFTATDTALDGSMTYDPLGKILGSTGMIGNLGYQSEWTDTLTGRVNMASRWYNTSTGQFDTADTAHNSPVPASVNANPYQYGDANPLTVTDPTGHFGFSPFKNVWHSVSHVVHQAASVVSNTVSAAYHQTMSFAYSAASYGMGAVSSAADEFGAHSLAKAIATGRKAVASKAAKEHQSAKRSAARARQAGHALKVEAQRTIRKAVKHVKDAYHATKTWVKKHKDAIIEVVATVATIAATIALGPVGGLIVGVAINVAKDAAEGKIHSLGDLGKCGAAPGVRMDARSGDGRRRSRSRAADALGGLAVHASGQ